MGKVRIGISGWTYAGWRKRFYPEGLSQKKELAYASREFSTIELNGSFYSLQRPSSYKQWRDQTPTGFVFAIKGSRFITHTKRLRDVGQPLANFFASGVLCLEEKMGPFLWQLPPTLRYDRALIDEFLSQLPRDTDAAAELGRKHDQRVPEERAAVERTRKRKLRHALEVRHESFCTGEFIDLLRKHQAAFVFADAPKDWPEAEDLTAGFVYVRLHGAKQMYAGNYPDERLRDLARRIRAWESGKQGPRPKLLSSKKPPSRKNRDVFVYFDNDQKAKAPEDARRLAEMLEV